MCKCFIRPRPVAWFFFLLGFGTCIALGSWQVKRLHWKQGVIAEIAQAKTQPPLTTLPEDEAALSALQFRKATVKGTWVAGTEFHLTPRYYRDQFGYQVIAPLTLADGRTLLVNRGWVPAAKKELATRPETTARGKATLTGLLRVGAERNFVTPANNPQKNLWFGRDVAQMAQSAGLKRVIPAMLDVVGTPPNPTSNGALREEVLSLPVPSDGTIRLKNDHLSYIITWYGIAAGILVIFLVYHRKK